jgi:hypothetical protein
MQRDGNISTARGGSGGGGIVFLNVEGGGHGHGGVGNGGMVKPGLPVFKPTGHERREEISDVVGGNDGHGLEGSDVRVSLCEDLCCYVF